MTIINFDGIQPGTSNLGPTYIESGFTLSNSDVASPDAFFVPSDYGGNPSNPSIRSLGSWYPNTDVVLVSNFPAAFSIESIRLDSCSYHSGGNPITVQFSARTSSGDSVTTSFLLDDSEGFQTLSFDSRFRDLTSLSFGRTSDDIFQFDDITLNQSPILILATASTAATEQIPTVIASDLTLTDLDSATLSNAQITVTDTYVRGQDMLAFANTDGAAYGDIVGTFDSIFGQLSLTSNGGASLAQWQAALRAVRYVNTSDAATGSSRSIVFQASDGTYQSSQVSRTISIVPLNDGPSISLPDTIDAAEDRASPVMSVAFTDPDSGAGVVTTTFGVATGTLSATSTASVTVGGTNTARTLSGTVADINAFLASQALTYTSAPDASGPVPFNVSINDNGNTGAGGARTASDSSILNVAPVNDTPTGTGLTQSLTVLEDAGATVLFSAPPTIADIDSSVVTATLTLSSGSGTLQGAGIAAVASGTATYTITGSPSAVSTALAAVTFTPAANLSGSVTIGITVGDGVDPAASQGTDPAGTVAITVTPVNDAPAGTDNTLTLLEDGSHSFAAADFGFSDPTDGGANALQAIVIETLPGAGSLTLADAAVTAGQPIPVNALTQLVYRPAPDANGTAYASFDFRVVDNGGTATGGTDASAATNRITVDVTAVNDAPVPGGDGQLGVLQGGTVAVTTADLTAFDVDSAPAQLTYTVTGTTHGEVRLNGVALGVADTFTQVDLEANLVTFRQDGSANAAAGFAVTVGDGTAAAVPATVTATVDTTAPVVDLATATVSIPEGNTGTTAFDVMLTRTGNINLASAVAYALAGAGTNPADADDFGGTLPSGTATFAIGESTTTIRLLVSGDTTIEPDEGFTLTLSSPSFATLGTSTAIGTIAADDFPPPSEPTGPTVTPNGQGGNTITSSDPAQITEGLGTPGIDLVRFDGPETVVLPGDIENVLLLGSGNSGVQGNGLSNALTGNAGANLILGGGGNDTVLGGDGDDVAFGNQDDDALFGNQGSDSLLCGEGRDVAFGGQGNDQVFGNLADDLVLGNLGADILFGGQGSDSLFGGQGNDVLSGDLGDDVLSGDQGNDLLDGGTGADRYVFGQISGTDIVLGFSQAEGDRIDLQGQSYVLVIRQDGSAQLDLSGGGRVILAGILAGAVNQGCFA